MITLLLLVRATYIYCCSSHISHSWWITHSMQCHQRCCNNIPSLLQRTTPIAHSFCKGFTQHGLHILVTAPFCCDRKTRAACVQSFALSQQATIEGVHMPWSLYYCLFAPHTYRVFHNSWNKAIGHKSRVLNDTTMMITFIERWKDNIL